MKKLKVLFVALLINGGLAFNAKAVPVDIAFVVDQSISMRSEFNWIPNAINAIDTALTNESIVTSTRYGIAGYMTHAGNEPGAYNQNGKRLAYQDLTTNLTAVTDEASYAATHLYGTRELGYHAADWARTGFNWDNNAVKIMILLTDENADQGSVIADVGQGSDEKNLGKLLDDDNFLLNVVAPSSKNDQWDEAVYDINSTYQGFFNLSYLRSNPDDFTATFVDAKVGEIKKEADKKPSTGIPEPSMLALMGIGLLGFGFIRRRT